jgi:DNA-binding transcriptional ArsR family regulator
MEISERFSQTSGLMCEPSRAKMLWALLDGKAFTATELAATADISSTSASNHLSKLLEASLLKVESQGRHRYYALANDDVAYAVEALAQLSKISEMEKRKTVVPTGIQYCRTCYDHLAGYVSIALVEAMEKKNYLKKIDKEFAVTKKGWEWLMDFNIAQENYTSIRRTLARQCLDWSERKPHLAGKLGADLLEAMLERKWFRKKAMSREMVLTAAGRKGLNERLGISLP